MRISNGQAKLLGDIVGNIAVAWFAGGIISAIFVGYPSKTEIFLSMTTGGILCGLFTLFALILVRDIN